MICRNCGFEHNNKNACPRCKTSNKTKIASKVESAVLGTEAALFASAIGVSSLNSEETKEKINLSNSVASNEIEKESSENINILNEENNSDIDETVEQDSILNEKNTNVEDFTNAKSETSELSNHDDGIDLKENSIGITPDIKSNNSVKEKEEESEENPDEKEEKSEENPDGKEEESEENPDEKEKESEENPDEKEEAAPAASYNDINIDYLTFSKALICLEGAIALEEDGLGDTLSVFNTDKYDRYGEVDNDTTRLKKINNTSFNNIGKSQNTASWKESTNSLLGRMHKTVDACKKADESAAEIFDSLLKGDSLLRQMVTIEDMLSGNFAEYSDDYAFAKEELSALISQFESEYLELKESGGIKVDTLNRMADNFIYLINNNSSYFNDIEEYLEGMAIRQVLEIPTRDEMSEAQEKLYDNHVSTAIKNTENGVPTSLDAQFLEKNRNELNRNYESEKEKYDENVADKKQLSNSQNRQGALGGGTISIYGMQEEERLKDKINDYETNEEPNYRAALEANMQATELYSKAIGILEEEQYKADTELNISNATQLELKTVEFNTAKQQYKAGTITEEQYEEKKLEFSQTYAEYHNYNKLYHSQWDKYEAAKNFEKVKTLETEKNALIEDFNKAYEANDTKAMEDSYSAILSKNTDISLAQTEASLAITADFESNCNSRIDHFSINPWAEYDDFTIMYYDANGKEISAPDDYELAIYLASNPEEYEKMKYYAYLPARVREYTDALIAEFDKYGVREYDSKFLNYAYNAMDEDSFKGYFLNIAQQGNVIIGNDRADHLINILEDSNLDGVIIAFDGIFIDGIGKFIDSIPKFISPTGISSVYDCKSAAVSEYLVDTYQGNFLGLTMNDFYQVNVSVGNMVIPMVASAIPGVGSWVGPILMGLSAAGSATNEAVQLGMDETHARIYGAISGSAEVLMEKFLGGFFKGEGIGSAVMDTVNKKLLSELTKKAFYRFISSRLESMLNEMTEEFIQEYFNNLVFNLVNSFDSSKTMVEIDENGNLKIVDNKVLNSVATTFGGEKQYGYVNLDDYIVDKNGNLIDRKSNLYNYFIDENGHIVDGKTGKIVENELSSLAKFDEEGHALGNSFIKDKNGNLILDSSGMPIENAYSKSLIEANQTKLSDGLLAAKYAAWTTIFMGGVGSVTGIKSIIDTGYENTYSIAYKQALSQNKFNVVKTISDAKATISEISEMQKSGKGLNDMIKDIQNGAKFNESFDNYLKNNNINKESLSEYKLSELRDNFTLENFVEAVEMIKTSTSGSTTFTLTEEGIKGLKDNLISLNKNIEESLQEKKKWSDYIVNENLSSKEIIEVLNTINTIESGLTDLIAQKNQTEEAIVLAESTIDNKATKLTELLINRSLQSDDLIEETNKNLFEKTISQTIDTYRLAYHELETINAEIESLTNEIKSLNESEMAKKSELETKLSDLEIKRDGILSVQEKIETSIKEKISEYSEQITENYTEQNNIHEKIKNIEEQLKSEGLSEEQIRNLTTELTELNGKLIESENLVNKLTKIRNDLKEFNLQKFLLDPVTIIEMQTRVDVKTTELKAKQNELSKIQSSLDILEKQYKNKSKKGMTKKQSEILLEELNSKRSLVDALNKGVTTLQNEISYLQNKIVTNNNTDASSILNNITVENGQVTILSQVGIIGMSGLINIGSGSIQGGISTIENYIKELRVKREEILKELNDDSENGGNSNLTKNELELKEEQIKNIDREINSKKTLKEQIQRAAMKRGLLSYPMKRLLNDLEEEVRILELRKNDTNIDEKAVEDDRNNIGKNVMEIMKSIKYYEALRNNLSVSPKGTELTLVYNNIINNLQKQLSNSINQIQFGDVQVNYSKLIYETVADFDAQIEDCYVQFQRATSKEDIAHYNEQINALQFAKKELIKNASVFGKVDEELLSYLEQNSKDMEYINQIRMANREATIEKIKAAQEAASKESDPLAIAKIFADNDLIMSLDDVELSSSQVTDLTKYILENYYEKSAIMKSYVENMACVNTDIAQVLLENGKLDYLSSKSATKSSIEYAIKYSLETNKNLDMLKNATIAVNDVESLKLLNDNELFNLSAKYTQGIDYMQFVFESMSDFTDISEVLNYVIDMANNNADVAEYLISHDSRFSIDETGKILFNDNIESQATTIDIFKKFESENIGVDEFIVQMQNLSNKKQNFLDENMFKTILNSKKISLDDFVKILDNNVVLLANYASKIKTVREMKNVMSKLTNPYLIDYKSNYAYVVAHNVSESVYTNYLLKLSNSKSGVINALRFDPNISKNVIKKLMSNSEFAKTFTEIINENDIYEKVKFNQIYNFCSESILPMLIKKMNTFDKNMVTHLLNTNINGSKFVIERITEYFDNSIKSHGIHAREIQNSFIIKACCTEIKVISDHGGYWNWNGRKINIGTNMSTFFHEMGHMLFSTILSETVPNYKKILSRVELNQDMISKLNSIISKIREDSKINAEAMFNEKIEAMGMTYDQYRASLIDEFSNKTSKDIIQMFIDIGYNKEEVIEIFKLLKLNNKQISNIKKYVDVSLLVDQMIKSEKSILKENYERKYFSEWGAITDIISAIKLNNNPLDDNFYQHEPKYYKKKSNLDIHELVADYTSMVMIEKANGSLALSDIGIKSYNVSGIESPLAFLRELIGDECFQMLDDVYNVFVEFGTNGTIESQENGTIVAEHPSTIITKINNAIKSFKEKFKFNSYKENSEEAQTMNESIDNGINIFSSKFTLDQKIDIVNELIKKIKASEDIDETLCVKIFEDTYSLLSGDNKIFVKNYLDEVHAISLQKSMLDVNTKLPKNISSKQVNNMFNHITEIDKQTEIINSVLSRMINGEVLSETTYKAIFESKIFNENSQFSIDYLNNILKNGLNIGGVNLVGNDKLAEVVKNIYEEARKSTFQVKNMNQLHSYCDHTESHVLQVAFLAISSYGKIVSSAVDVSLDVKRNANTKINELFYAGLFHDLGMTVGASFDNGNPINPGVALTVLNNNAYAEIVGKVIDISDKKIASEVRENHTLNTALIILSNRALIESLGLNPDRLALLCFSHSKSNSGVGVLNSESDWSFSIQKILNAVETINNYYKNSGSTKKISFDTSTFGTLLPGSETLTKSKQKIEVNRIKSKKRLIVSEFVFNEHVIEELALEGLALRIGDAYVSKAQIVLDTPVKWWGKDLKGNKKVYSATRFVLTQSGAYMAYDPTIGVLYDDTVINSEEIETSNKYGYAYFMLSGGEMIPWKVTKSGKKDAADNNIYEFGQNIAATKDSKGIYENIEDSLMFSERVEEKVLFPGDKDYTKLYATNKGEWYSEKIEKGIIVSRTYYTRELGKKYVKIEEMLGLSIDPKDTVSMDATFGSHGNDIISSVGKFLVGENNVTYWLSNEKNSFGDLILRSNFEILDMSNFPFNSITKGIVERVGELATSSYVKNDVNIVVKNNQFKRHFKKNKNGKYEGIDAIGETYIAYLKVLATQNNNINFSINEISLQSFVSNMDSASFRDVMHSLSSIGNVFNVKSMVSVLPTAIKEIIKDKLGFSNVNISYAFAEIINEACKSEYSSDLYIERLSGYSESQINGINDLVMSIYNNLDLTKKDIDNKTSKYQNSVMNLVSSMHKIIVNINHTNGRKFDITEHFIMDIIDISSRLVPRTATPEEVNNMIATLLCSNIFLDSKITSKEELSNAVKTMVYDKVVKKIISPILSKSKLTDIEKSYLEIYNKLNDAINTADQSLKEKKLLEILITDDYKIRSDVYNLFKGKLNAFETRLMYNYFEAKLKAKAQEITDIELKAKADHRIRNELRVMSQEMMKNDDVASKSKPLPKKGTNPWNNSFETLVIYSALVESASYMEFDLIEELFPKDMADSIIKTIKSQFENNKGIVSEEYWKSFFRNEDIRNYISKKSDAEFAKIYDYLTSSSSDMLKTILKNSYLAVSKSAYSPNSVVNNTFGISANEISSYMENYGCTFEEAIIIYNEKHSNNKYSGLEYVLSTLVVSKKQIEIYKSLITQYDKMITSATSKIEKDSALESKTNLENVVREISEKIVNFERYHNYILDAKGKGVKICEIEDSLSHYSELEMELLKLNEDMSKIEDAITIEKDIAKKSKLEVKKSDIQKEIKYKNLLLKESEELIIDAELRLIKKNAVDVDTTKLYAAYHKLILDRTSDIYKKLEEKENEIGSKKTYSNNLADLNNKIKEIDKRLDELNLLTPATAFLAKKITTEIAELMEERVSLCAKISKLTPPLDILDTLNKILNNTEYETELDDLGLSDSNKTAIMEYRRLAYYETALEIYEEGRNVKFTEEEFQNLFTSLDKTSIAYIKKINLEEFWKLKGISKGLRPKSDYSVADIKNSSINWSLESYFSRFTEDGRSDILKEMFDVVIADKHVIRFVTSKTFLSRILPSSKDSIEGREKFDRGSIITEAYFTKDSKVKYKNIDELNAYFGLYLKPGDIYVCSYDISNDYVRIGFSSGNELSANYMWIPGGKTLNLINDSGSKKLGVLDIVLTNMPMDVNNYIMYVFGS